MVNSCGLYLLSSSSTNTGSLISIEPGRVRFADVLPPRSDISLYTPEFFRFAYQGFLLRFVTLPINLNCFFRHFNCINVQKHPN